MAGAGARSLELMARARRVLPGGVSSPVRAFGAVGGSPPFLARGEGAYVIDVDGHRYLDHVLGYGPHILGHAPPGVVAALTAQAALGTALGAPHELEVELGERIAAAIPSIEMVRFVNSGTEAAMSAVRLARAATGRNRIVTCAGGYHGHADALLAQAGSGIATLGIPGSPGVPPAAVADTVVVPFNDLGAVADLFDAGRASIAAVIVEPVAGNMGCVPPLPGYLGGLRELTRRAGALLVFDEVMTGFRVAPGGAQQLLGITPDLTCLGKVIGGGLPVGAYGGSRELMSLVAPAGSVYQAGTLSGNPLAMAAGCAVLDELGSGNAHIRLEELGARLEGGLRAAAAAAGMPCAVNRVGSMLTPFVGVETVTDLAGAQAAPADLFAHLHRRWLESGVNWPPSRFEAAFLSTAHTPVDVDRTVEVFAAALATAPA